MVSLLRPRSNCDCGWVHRRCATTHNFVVATGDSRIRTSFRLGRSCNERHWLIRSIDGRQACSRSTCVVVHVVGHVSLFEFVSSSSISTKGNRPKQRSQSAHEAVGDGKLELEPKWPQAPPRPPRIVLDMSSRVFTRVRVVPGWCSKHRHLEPTPAPGWLEGGSRVAPGWRDLADAPTP